MKDILTTLLTHGYASADAHPALLQAEVREELKRKAAEWGARLSYDGRMQTAALMVPAAENTLAPLERAALLTCYIALRLQSEAYRLSHQKEPIRHVTTQAIEAARSSRQFTIRADQLVANFPNVFVRVNEASAALNTLRDRGFLVTHSTGIFVEGPLLGHAFDREKVQQLLDGEMAGLFDHLKPEDAPDNTFDQLVLATVQKLPKGEARKKALEDRLPNHNWKSIKPALDRLVAMDLMDHREAGPARYYFVPEA